MAQTQMEWVKLSVRKPINWNTGDLSFRIDGKPADGNILYYQCEWAFTSTKLKWALDENHFDKIEWLDEAAPVPDPVWDAEKAGKFAEWVAAEYHQDNNGNSWVTHDAYDNPDLFGYSGPPEQYTTAQLIQTFLNRPK